LLQQRG
jgi:hypothetical protein